jgi:hypothetical protein
MQHGEIVAAPLKSNIVLTQLKNEQEKLNNDLGISKIFLTKNFNWQKSIHGKK